MGEEGTTVVVGGGEGGKLSLGEEKERHARFLADQEEEAERVFAEEHKKEEGQLEAGAAGCPLLRSLSRELCCLVATYLPPEDLARLAQTCRRLSLVARCVRQRAIALHLCKEHKDVWHSKENFGDFSFKERSLSLRQDGTFVFKYEEEWATEDNYHHTVKRSTGVWKVDNVADPQEVILTGLGVFKSKDNEKKVERAWPHQQTLLISELNAWTKEH
ncbi:hypothetical protein QOT17_004446 [Balamuthia mandrillaris]